MGECKEGNYQSVPYWWAIKSCENYKEEHSDCTSIAARFQQYFIHGKFLDCDSWKEKYNNCSLWENQKDFEAFKRLAEAEKNRVEERSIAHVQNDIWERRSAPPPDWNKPLPEDIQSEYKDSYLERMANQKNNNEEIESDAKSNSCAIT